ncbi:putative efflux protein, MATE family [Pilibacter termitis]|uniref:Probable multidrug resistance protein NorM n=1 Tax=Pilibacter termitis TaxID=263852 RepID=A0A1T4NAB9_9ENTE|nr:MATE family efflux transporter [Pilibacter termitis]SJZ75778.1 putative efflux protein, MATE family [Pilibacter termitis]
MKNNELRTTHRKEILRLAIPNTIENVLQMTVGFVDSLLIAKISLIAISAVGVVNGLLAIFQAIFIALSIAATSVIARNIGAKKLNSARVAVFHAILLSVIVSTFLGLLVLFFGKQILILSGANDEILPLAQHFFLLVGGLSVFWSILTVLGAVLRANGDAKTPMYVSLLVNLINILLDYLLIFGVGSLPPLGIIGAGVGTTLSRLIGCIILFRKLQRTKLKIDKNVLKTKESIAKMIKLSIPSAIERFMMRFGDILINRLLLNLGTMLFASLTIFENFASFTFMPAFAVAAATATLVGREFGAKNMENVREIRKESNHICLLFMLFTALILCLFGDFFARAFTENTTALKFLNQSLPFYALGLPVLAYSLVDTSALQATGDTKTPMFATTIGMLFIRVTFVALFCLYFRFQLIGVAIATLLDNFWRAIFLRWTLNKRMIK